MEDLIGDLIGDLLHLGVYLSAADGGVDLDDTDSVLGLADEWIDRGHTYFRDEITGGDDLAPIASAGYINALGVSAPVDDEAAGS